MLIIFPDSSLSKTSPLLSNLYFQQTLCTFLFFFMTYCVKSIPCIDGYYLEQGQLSSDYTTKNMIPLPQLPLTSCSSSRRNGAFSSSSPIHWILVSSGSCAGHHQCGAISFWVKEPCHVQRTMFPVFHPILWLSFSFVLPHFPQIPRVLVGFI